MIRLKPREGENGLRSEDVVDFLNREGYRVALVLLGAVRDYSGEHLDIPAITAAGRATGAIMAWDLAHAAGNVSLRMVSTGSWTGPASLVQLQVPRHGPEPGGIAGAFVHERHLLESVVGEADRLVERRPEDPVPDATPPWNTLTMRTPGRCPIRRSSRWRRRWCPWRCSPRSAWITCGSASIRLTGYLEELLDGLIDGRPIKIITRDATGAPGNSAFDSAHGSAETEEDRAGMRVEHGVIADAREPDVIRLAPAPLYVSPYDCSRTAQALIEVVEFVD